MFFLHCVLLISYFLPRNLVFSDELPFLDGLSCVDPNFKLFEKLYFLDWILADNRPVFLDEHNNFSCQYLPPSKEVPSSVHALRPGDIKVVAALGDSLSVANGAGADRLINVINQYLGLSFTVGGFIRTFNDVVKHADHVQEHFSLPNVLKFYNPDILGWSYGVAKPGESRNLLNMAKAGSKARDLHEQADNLIEVLTSNPYYKLKENWKLLTLFIGANNLCQFCTDPLSKPEHFVRDIREVLDKLQSKVPRMFVNLLTIMNVEQVVRLGDDIKGCRMAHVCFCDCVLSNTPENKTKYQNYLKKYRSGLKDLVKSGRYDTSDDFTVVIQPMMENASPPLKPDGSEDLSYLAPDCFHFSQRGHNLAGRALWNSMLEPVGKKRSTWDNNGEVLCPSEEYPFLATSKNSGNATESDENGFSTESPKL